MILSPLIRALEAIYLHDSLDMLSYENEAPSLHLFLLLDPEWEGEMDAIKPVQNPASP